MNPRERDRDNHAGVIDELVAGTWQEPGTGRRHGIPIHDIVIRASLDGCEAELVRTRHAGQKLCVVCDINTHQALGQRVHRALQAAGMNASLHVWQTPDCSDKGVDEIRSATRGCEALIAVGSGTINDTVKYASFLDRRAYSVFATSPMNAYTTSTASVSFDGFKRSITCHGPDAVFFDLGVLAACPRRLVSAAFADVICRTTCQVDWLMSHLFFGTAYSNTPYALLAYDEAGMIANAANMLAGDLESIAMLARICALMGLGTSFTSTTHSGSMGEHLISHYIDMFAGELHPGTSHGEQVGVATLTMSRLQHHVLNAGTPPLMQATRIPVDALHARHGRSIGGKLIEQTQAKALDASQADALNGRLAQHWPLWRTQLRDAMLPYAQLHEAMKQAGCALSASDLGIDADFYREAVVNARYIRDRYSMLDVVDDSVGLADFVDAVPIGDPAAMPAVSLG